MAEICLSRIKSSAFKISSYAGLSVIQEGNCASQSNQGCDFLVYASMIKLISGNVLFILLVENVTIIEDVEPHW